MQPQPTRTPWGPQHTQAGLSVASFPALNLQAWPPWGGWCPGRCADLGHRAGWASARGSGCGFSSLQLQRLRSLGPDLNFLSSVPEAGLSRQLCHTRRGVPRGGVGLGRLGGPARVAPGQGGTETGYLQPLAGKEAPGSPGTPPQVGRDPPTPGCALPVTWEQTQPGREGRRGQRVVVWAGRGGRFWPVLWGLWLLGLLTRLPCSGGLGGLFLSPVQGARQGGHRWAHELATHTFL